MLKSMACWPSSAFLEGKSNEEKRAKGKLMQEPRDTYSQLLQRTGDCLVPEEPLPVSPLWHYIAILFFFSIPLSSLAINALQVPQILLLWVVTLAPYLYNPCSLLISPHWKKLRRKHKVMALVTSSLTIIPALSLHPDVLLDYPFKATLGFLVVNAFVGWEYQKIAWDLIEILPTLTLAGSATVTFRPSPEFFTCARQAIEDMCQDKENKAYLNNFLSHIVHIAEGYLGSIEGQTLLWAILGAIIIDKAPPLLAGVTAWLGIPNMHESFWELMMLTLVGIVLLMAAFQAFIHVHIIHAVEEYQLQHPKEE